MTIGRDPKTPDMLQGHRWTPWIQVILGSWIDELEGFGVWPVSLTNMLKQTTVKPLDLFMVLNRLCDSTVVT